MLQEIQNRSTCFLGILFLSRTHRRLGATARQAHTHRLDGAGHRVGSIHTSTGTRAGDGAALNLLQALVGELVIGVRANGFEHRHDIQLASVPGNAAGQNGATVHKDARAIHARHGHHAGRHVLIATANSHKAIHAFTTDDRLNGIRNHLATHERILHALGPHGDAVGDGDCVENNRLATGLVGAALSFLRK